MKDLDGAGDDGGSGEGEVFGGELGAGLGLEGGSVFGDVVELGLQRGEVDVVESGRWVVRLGWVSHQGPASARRIGERVSGSAATVSSAVSMRVGGQPRVRASWRAACKVWRVHRPVGLSSARRARRQRSTRASRSVMPQRVRTLLLPPRPSPCRDGRGGVGGGGLLGLLLWVGPQFCGHPPRRTAATRRVGGGRRCAATRSTAALTRLGIRVDLGCRRRGGGRSAATPGRPAPIRVLRGEVVAVGEVASSVPAVLDPYEAGVGELADSPVHGVNRTVQPDSQQFPAGHALPGGIAVAQEEGVDTERGVGDVGVDDPFGHEREGLVLDPQASRPEEVVGRDGGR